MTVQQPLTRADIARFAPDPRAIKWFENASAQMSDSTDLADAIASSSFVTLAPNPVLGSERVLVVSPRLTLVDGGPNSTVTLGIATTGVVAGGYGSAAAVASFSVNDTGQLTLASAVPIAIDAGQVPTGVFPVPRGGTGAATLTGYAKGNGTAPMTASPTIPVADVVGAVDLASAQSLSNKTLDQLRTAQAATVGVAAQAAWVPVLIGATTYKLLLAV